MFDVVAIRRILLLAVAASTASWAISREESTEAASSVRAQRIVSLSPVITETLLALGAGDHVVGRSDWCAWPDDRADVPTMGSTFTPRLEAIAGLRPDLIAGHGPLPAAAASWEAIAPVADLPWRTVDDLRASIRELGVWTGRGDAADSWVGALTDALTSTVTPDSPTALLIYGSPDPAEGIWFIAPDTLHGAALAAAGLRNAVQSHAGVPSLSVERLLELDPDWIVWMVSDDSLPDGQREAYLHAFDALPTLRAPRSGHIAVLAQERWLLPGTSLIDFVDALKSAVEVER